MATTLHRHDIDHKDFKLLAQFCHALKKLEDCNGLALYLELGTTELTLPVWYQSGTGWQLSRYKAFAKEAIGIETQEFRRICRYLKVNEAHLVDVLFRFSMLAVAPGQKHTESRKFRQSFAGKRKGAWFDDEAATSFGFVLEQRRAEGNFRQKKG